MSQASSGYERVSGDRYFTPAWPIEALLSIEGFGDGHQVLDPCAGGWDIVSTLNRRGIPAIGFDIEPPPPEAPEYSTAFYSQDFLKWNGAMLKQQHIDWKHILTNPPYGRGGRTAVKFIEHALELTKITNGKVVMLLRVDFDSAHGRRPIFGNHPAFVGKWVLTKRIRWANLPQSVSGPTDNHAIFVWDWDRARRWATQPVLGYLP